MKYKNIESFAAITQIENLQLKILNELWGLIFDAFDIIKYFWITSQNTLIVGSSVLSGMHLTVCIVIVYRLINTLHYVHPSKMHFSTICKQYNNEYT